MTILIDTSVIIDHLRGDKAATSAMRGAVASGERLASSILTKVEVLAGMRPQEVQETRAVLDILHLVPVDDAIAEQAGAFANQYLRSYPGVDVTDYVIAATAWNLGAQLWTRNIKHFPMFSGLLSPY
jgi:predicted nucleic acid-binding protein